MKRFVALLFVALVSPAYAAQAYPAAPSEASSPGPEIRLLGEYVGMLTGGWRPTEWGAQVYAASTREAHGVLHDGGLPGAGAKADSRHQMAGRLVASALRLSGEEFDAVVADGRCWVYDRRGVLRGILHKTLRSSPTEGLLPPPGAIVLFDGSSTSELGGARLSPEGWLMEGAITRRPFRDFTMHVEFRTPYQPGNTGQGRGNSGVYIQGRYEVQILDSFGLPGVENECGSLYRLRRPDVNMCLPPLSWQTYDMAFRAARFDASGRKMEPARITLRHNGVLVHNNVEIPRKTGAGQKEGPEPRPILFQNHRDPVRFRNLWIVETPPGDAA